MATLIGIIYLLSVIERLQICLLSPFNCGFTIATIISINQTKISSEICSVSLTLIYSLIALHLSSSNWLFAENKMKNSQHAQTEFIATNLTVKQTRPLIYLAGAKLLTVFCYFLPFACIVSQLIYPSNATVDDNNNNNEDDNGGGVHNNTSTDQIFNDLVVLLLTRLALGTITILIVRHNVSYSSIAYLMPVIILSAVILLIPLFDLENLFTKFTICIIMFIYVTLSLLFDVIGHRSIEFDLRSTPKVISLTFATFIEHLIDVAIVVVYLNDWISAKIIVTSLAIVSLSILCQKLATPSEQYNNFHTKSQVL